MTTSRKRVERDPGSDAAVDKTRMRELPWTHPCSAWTETVCVLEPVEGGVGGRWGIRSKEVQRGAHG